MNLCNRVRFNVSAHIAEIDEVSENVEEVLDVYSDEEDSIEKDFSGDESNAAVDDDHKELSVKSLTQEEIIANVRANIKGLIANVPERTTDVVKMGVEYLWKLHANAPPGEKEVALQKAFDSRPQEFSATITDEKDVELSLKEDGYIKFISRVLLYDYILEAFIKIFEGEDKLWNTPQLMCQKAVTSAQFRLWKGKKRPTDIQRVMDIVVVGLRQDLNLNLDCEKLVSKSSLHSALEVPFKVANTHPSANRHSMYDGLSKLAQWTIKGKNHIERLIELELRAEDSSWINYTDEIEKLKHQLTNQIFDNLFSEVIETCKKSKSSITCM